MHVFDCIAKELFLSSNHMFIAWFICSCKYLIGSMHRNTLVSYTAIRGIARIFCKGIPTVKIWGACMAPNH